MQKSRRFSPRSNIRNMKLTARRECSAVVSAETGTKKRRVNEMIDNTSHQKRVKA